jgi:hypothetical protein
MRYLIICCSVLFLIGYHSQNKIKELVFAIATNTINSSYEKISLQNISVLPAGEKPQYDAAECIFLSEPSTAKNLDHTSEIVIRKANWHDKLNLEKSDVAAVNEILKKYGDNGIYQLFRLLPDEVMWWIRVDKSLSLISLTKAIHETHHAINKVLSYCNDRYASYYFEGDVWTTELRTGDTANYSIVTETIPKKYGEGSMQTSNYYPYILKSKTYSGNDFIVLLDEFNAYTSAARLEINLHPSEIYQKLRTSGLTSYGGNLQGMSDFMLYTLCYLQAARTHYPASYQKIRNSPLLVAQIMRVWTAAEKALHDGYQYTASGGGIFLVQPELIDTIYSQQYLTELDRLGIVHAASADWSGSYLAKISSKNKSPDKM